MRHVNYTFPSVISSNYRLTEGSEFEKEKEPQFRSFDRRSVAPKVTPSRTYTVKQVRTNSVDRIRYNPMAGTASGVQKLNEDAKIGLLRKKGSQSNLRGSVAAGGSGGSTVTVARKASHGVLQRYKF